MTEYNSQDTITNSESETSSNPTPKASPKRSLIESNHKTPSSTHIYKNKFGTKECIFWKAGNCKKGTLCTYKHRGADQYMNLNSNPPITLNPTQIMESVLNYIKGEANANRLFIREEMDANRFHLSHEAEAWRSLIAKEASRQGTATSERNNSRGQHRRKTAYEPKEQSTTDSRRKNTNSKKNQKNHAQETPENSLIIRNHTERTLMINDQSLVEEPPRTPIKNKSLRNSTLSEKNKNSHTRETPENHTQNGQRSERFLKDNNRTPIKDPPRTPTRKDQFSTERSEKHKKKKSHLETHAEKTARWTRN